MPLACLYIEARAICWGNMMFQRFQSCRSNRDRRFHFMCNIVDEVCLYFIDPFLFPDCLIHKNEGRIADEEDEEESQHGPCQVFSKKMVVIFKLSKDQCSRIKKY